MLTDSEIESIFSQMDLLTEDARNRFRMMGEFSSELVSDQVIFTLSEAQTETVNMEVGSAKLERDS